MPAAPAQAHAHVDVEVELEVADVVHAALALFVRRARYAVVGYVLALGMVLMLLEAPGGLQLIPREILRPLAISLVLLPAFLFGFIYWNTKGQFARSGKAVRSMRYHFCAESLDVHSETRGGFLPWFAFHEAIETKLSFLLFLSPHEHYLIPKRCFHDPAGVETVRGLLQEQMSGKAHLRKT
jgi:hypothetical protein